MNPQCRNNIVEYKAHCGDCRDDKSYLLCSAKDFQQTMCMIIMWDMIYISWFMKKADHKVTVVHPSPPHLLGCNAGVIR